MEFISDIIPTTLFSSLTEGNVLQALFVALLVGFAIQAMGSAGVPMHSRHRAAAEARVPHPGQASCGWRRSVRSARSPKVVGATGFDAVIQLAGADARVLSRPASSSCSVCSARCSWVVTRVSIFKLVRYLAREYLLIVATSSSESALPRLIAKTGARRCASRPLSESSCRPGIPSTWTAPRSTSRWRRCSSPTRWAIRCRLARAVVAAGVHDHRVQGRGRCHRRRPRDAGRAASRAIGPTSRRRRSHRRHRPSSCPRPVRSPTSPATLRPPCWSGHVDALDGQRPHAEVCWTGTFLSTKRRWSTTRPTKAQPRSREPAEAGAGR